MCMYRYNSNLKNNDKICIRDVFLQITSNINVVPLEVIELPQRSISLSNAILHFFFYIPL